jgi:two-component system, OmpR family, KDP operon response regulator KdpE
MGGVSPTPEFDNFPSVPQNVGHVQQLGRMAGAGCARKARTFVQAPDPRLRSRSRQDPQNAERADSQTVSRRGHRLIVAGRRILVVDDEPQITRVLRTTLSSHGYEIRVANDAEAALDVVTDWPPELIITDLSMPNMTGIELTRKVRSKSEIPIVVLSVRGEERSKIEALDAGADDYVTKPFNMSELLARVRAHLRRFTPPETEEKEISVGDFKINLPGHQIFVRGEEVRLTPKEFDLLVHFARHPDKVITHTVLLRSIWGPQSVNQNEYLRVFVGQLRKKLEAGADRHYILTEPWIGYRFTPGE